MNYLAVIGLLLRVSSTLINDHDRRKRLGEACLILEKRNRNVEVIYIIVTFNYEVE